jgi:chromosome segregation ATPase
MADDELDELYWVKPEGFTALRTRLAAAAKHRGDAAAAKRISATRKPTTAAWIVNLLARSNEEAKQRLTYLGERLRAAHAAMDGSRIRELSTQQRKLVDELARAAFEAAELTDPPAALRDDVTGTLQAAIADPDVTARLGRLAKAERWSGFGEFGDTAPVSTVARGGKAKAEPRQARQRPARNDPSDGNLKAARQQLETVRATVAAAERAKAVADDERSERQAELATARLRHGEARKRLQEAERDLNAAADAHDKAKQASRDAAELVKEAKARLKQIDSIT